MSLTCWSRPATEVRWPASLRKTAAQGGGHQGGADVVAGHVGDDHAEAVVPGPVVEEVAADVARGARYAGHLDGAHPQGLRGEQAELDAGGQLQLTLQLLAVAFGVDQAGVVDLRGGGVGDGADELQVAGAEGAAAALTGQVDDAVDLLRAASLGADLQGHAHEADGLAQLVEVEGLGGHGVAGVADDALAGLEDLAADALAGLDAHLAGQPFGQADAGPDAQLAALEVYEHDGGALAVQQMGGLLDGKGADGVLIQQGADALAHVEEEVEFLVAAGQLDGQAGHVLVGGQQAADHLGGGFRCGAGVERGADDADGPARAPAGQPDGAAQLLDAAAGGLLDELQPRAGQVGEPLQHGGVVLRLEPGLFRAVPLLAVRKQPEHGGPSLRGVCVAGRNVHGLYTSVGGRPTVSCGMAGGVVLVLVVVLGRWTVDGLRIADCGLNGLAHLTQVPSEAGPT